MQSCQDHPIYAVIPISSHYNISHPFEHWLLPMYIFADRQFITTTILIAEVIFSFLFMSFLVLIYKLFLIHPALYQAFVELYIRQVYFSVCLWIFVTDLIVKVVSLSCLGAQPITTFKNAPLPIHFFSGVLKTLWRRQRLFRRIPEMAEKQQLKQKKNW